MIDIKHLVYFKHSVNFIMDLPRTQQGNDSIWTIVDRFSKQAHFLPVRKTINAEHIAKICLPQVFKHHGMPECIVGDRDPRTTRKRYLIVWEQNFNFLRLIILKQMGKVKLQIQRYWMLCCGSKDSEVVEFAYNNTTCFYGKGFF